MAGPKSREEQLRLWEEQSRVRQRDRLAYFRKEFGVEPDLPTEKKAKEIYSKIQKDEPYFKTAMAGPSARMQSLVSSDAFREALIGAEGAGKEEQRFADKASDALTWAIEAFGDAYGAYSNTQAVEGVRQSHQLKRLLKMKGPGGATFYQAMKAAAAKNGTLDTFYDDLAYVNSAFKMGIDLEKMDPDFKKEAHPEHTSTWADYKREHLDNIPHDPEKKKDCLAKVLVGAFEAGLPDAQKDAFSPEKAEKFAQQIKKRPVFKKFCEDPVRVKELLKEDPKDPDKHFNAVMGLYSPFAKVPKEKCNEALRKIKGMLPHMDGPKGHGKEWKALVESVSTIDLNDPKNSGPKKLQEIFDKTCGYAKGRKSLRGKQSDQNLVDQSFDVLAELGKCGPYAKMAAETVIDRTNEVRLGHDRNYDTISLSDFGASKAVRHSNHKKTYRALDVLPEEARSLPEIPKKKRGVASPLAEYTQELAPLASDNVLNEVEAAQAVALAVALSKAPVYYYSGDANKELSKGMKKYGRTVIDGTALLEGVMKLQMQDPAVKQLAEKYKDPEARKALFAGGRPEQALGKPGSAFDVSKLDVQKITQEYEAAKNPLQQQAGL
ncbi:MAG: hypothetical protein IKW92_04155 [Firmicutes bacterium]|nr:hypothetical protein [Bacillota bacterium]